MEGYPLLHYSISYDRERWTVSWLLEWIVKIYFHLSVACLLVCCESVFHIYHGCISLGWVWDNGMSLWKLLHLDLHWCSKDVLSLHLLTLALVHRVFSADFNPQFSAFSGNSQTQILSYFRTLPQQSGVQVEGEEESRKAQY